MELVGRTELARILGVDPLTVYKWTQQGKIPYYRVGRDYRYDPHEILSQARFTPEDENLRAEAD